MRGKEKYKNAEYDDCTVECLIKSGITKLRSTGRFPAALSYSLVQLIP
jgi:hypothetical protein